MQHTIRTGKILDALGEARGELLLALQHSPDNAFSKLHQHPVTKHIDGVNHYLERLHAIVDDEILPSELSSDETILIDQLATTLDAVTENGFVPAIAALRQGQYQESNRIILNEINTRFEGITNAANEFLNLQLQEAKAAFEQAEQNSHTFLLLFSVSTSVGLLVIFLVS